MWRRSYDIPPPDLDKASEHYPGNDPKYAMLDEACLPTTESLYTTALRVIPYWQSVIVPDIKGGKKVLIAAHGNSLRALVQVRGAPVSRAWRRSRARARARSRLSEGARSVRAAHAPAPQYLDNISNDEITELNIPTACPLVCVAPNPGRVRARNPVSPLTASIRASLADMNSTTPCAPSSRRWASARFQGGTWATRRVQLRALRNAPWQLTRARDAGVGALARAQDAIRAKIEGVKNQTK